MDDYILDRGWGAGLDLKNLIWIRAWFQCYPVVQSQLKLIPLLKKGEIDVKLSLFLIIIIWGWGRKLKLYWLSLIYYEFWNITKMGKNIGSTFMLFWKTILTSVLCMVLSSHWIFTQMIYSCRNNCWIQKWSSKK